MIVKKKMKSPLEELFVGENEAIILDIINRQAILEKQLQKFENRNAPPKFYGRWRNEGSEAELNSIITVIETRAIKEEWSLFELLDYLKKRKVKND